MNQALRTFDGIELPVAGIWTIDPAHTVISFVAGYMGITKVRGRFREFQGTVQVGEAPEDSGVEVTIQAASIDTGEPKRDGHLKSPDFLDVEAFPTLAFRSTKVERSGERALKVEGNLTIRDVTRPVVLEAEFVGTGVDPYGNARAGFSATIEIQREDFGVTWNVAVEDGWLVSQKVLIELEATILLQSEGEA